jgi:small-conductance mechanosensitive channel
MTPLVATSAVGALQIFGRRVSLGDRIQQGRHEGKVVEINLLETQIEQRPGEVTRVPHLLGLVRAMRVRRGSGSVEVRLSVAPEADPQEALAALQEAAGREGEARVELEQIDREGALFRVSVEAELERGALLMKLAAELRARHIGLGRLPGGGGA